MHAGRDRQFADRSKQQDQSREVKSQAAEVVAKWVLLARERREGV